LEKGDKEKTEEEEDEEEEEFYDRSPQNFNQPVVSNTMKELPKFDMSEFFNLQNVSDEVKDLLDVMAK
jgi:hypothetical protein